MFYRIQLLSTFQHDSAIIAKRVVICRGRWNDYPIQKSADGAIPTIAYKVLAFDRLFPSLMIEDFKH